MWLSFAAGLLQTDWRFRPFLYSCHDRHLYWSTCAFCLGLSIISAALPSTFSAHPPSSSPSNPLSISSLTWFSISSAWATSLSSSQYLPFTFHDPVPSFSAYFLLCSDNEMEIMLRDHLSRVFSLWIVPSISRYCHDHLSFSNNSTPLTIFASGLHWSF